MTIPDPSQLTADNGHQPLSEKFFLPYQVRWMRDKSPLRIIEKSRQVGMSYVDAYDSVRKASRKLRPAHVYVASSDLGTVRFYLEDCKFWAETLQIGAEDLGEQVIAETEKERITALVLRFASGFCIHGLSSNPNALVGKRGHIKLDEFAVHDHQDLVLRYAMPCTVWGYQLSILSTHRGRECLFNQIINDIKYRGNPMGWSHHRVDIHDAVAQGIVEKINRKSGLDYTRDEFLKAMRAKCFDEESWQQEFCCIPADESTAFITYQMLNACEAPGCMQSLAYLSGENTEPGNVNPEQRCFYVGVDVARKHHLCVIDVGEKVGDLVWDRLRIELQDKTFAEIEQELYPILELPQVKRCCIDATGLGMQLAERARARFGWKVVPITFNPTIKETMANNLRIAFEQRLLRIDPDPRLRSDLRGIKKEVRGDRTRFVAEVESGPDANGHCDRFWAKALRQHAALTPKARCGAVVID